ncbi:unnamed protein product [Penicillium glandicola]
MKLFSFCALSFVASAVASTSDVAPIELSSLATIYAFAIDGKEFDTLDKVFTTDATANYSTPLNVLAPLTTIQSVLSTSLECVTTQHLLGTQRIDVLSPITANSVTYFRAAHFGKGDLADQVAYAYGQYQDNWQRQATGTWRIVHRNLVYMAPVIGNLTVFVC